MKDERIIKTFAFEWWENFCPLCGGAVRISFRFCPWCGFDTKKEVTK